MTLTIRCDDYDVMKTFMTLSSVLLTAQLANAEIRETKMMADAIKAADSKTLLVFDLDNTVIEPTNQLGSDQWYYFLEEKYQKVDKLNEDEAYQKAMRVWNATQGLIKIKPVEKVTPKLIADAQARGIKTMGLTARTLDIASKSIEQLESIGVKMDRRAPHGKDMDIKSKDLAKYTRGVLFVGDRNDKGVLLKEFLTQINYKPLKIVFIDDKEKHVKNVEKALAGFAPYIGFRYGAADEKVKSFNEDLKQLTLFFHGELEVQ